MALTKPFCENGNKVAIPETTADGSVSYDQGFGAFYALPPEEGGLFIDRAQFNQLMYDTTSQVITNKNNITTIQGDVTTAKVNITALQRDVNALEGDVANIEGTISQVISSDVTPIGVYRNVENKTIGANGDFRTIQEAFRYVQTHQKQGTAQSLTLTLLENLSGNLNFLGAWYPYLVMDCNGFTLEGLIDITFSCFKIRNLKVNGRVTCKSSILELTDSVDINYQNEGIWPTSCFIAQGNSLVFIYASSINFTTIAGRNGINVFSNSSVQFYTGNLSPVITQTTGNNLFFVGNGGIIQLAGGINLNGVTVPKANQAANTITNAGLIIGNYYSI